MLGKLLKYDLKANFKFLAVFYALAIVSAVLTRVCFMNAETLAVQILGYIFNAMTISVVASILINTLMRAWVYFKRNLYGDEGYLMQTLPVKRADLLSAKCLMGLITMTASVVVVLATLSIAYLTPEGFEGIKTWLTGVATMLDSEVALLIVMMVGLVFLELLAILLCGFVGIIVGHQRLTNRTGWSVLFGFVCYIGMQQVVNIGVVILAVLNPKVRESLLTTNAVPDLSILSPVMAVGVVGYLVDIVVGYFLARGWFREVDLD